MDTLDGQLKASLLDSGDFGVTAACGAKTHSLVGMGGVGKTIAMTGLATQPDIKARFSGGIYFLSRGQEAKTVDVIEEIAIAVEKSGGIQYYEKVKSQQSAAEAAGIAAEWFWTKACEKEREKAFLFLCDYLWPTEVDTGFFHYLKILVSCNSNSRTVIPTRDAAIAVEAGSEISFNTREATGPVSEALRHAGIADEMDNAEFQEHLEQLLELCGGLPLVLAVVSRRFAIERSNDSNNVRFRKRKRELENE